MAEALHEVDSKHAEKEKAWSEKLAAALAEITIKDSLVKQHIKVAEEAVVGKTTSPTLESFSLSLLSTLYLGSRALSVESNAGVRRPRVLGVRNL